MTVQPRTVQPRVPAWSTRCVSARTAIVAALIACAFLALGALTGCGSTGTVRTGETLGGVAGLRSDLSRLTKDLDETMWALDALGAPRAEKESLRTAYDVYLRRLERLEAQAEHVADGAATFSARADAQIEAWRIEAGEMQNPRIRARSEERRAAAESDFTRLRDGLVQARRAYEGVQTDLRDIQIALDNDLNARGVAAIGDVMSEARRDADAAKAEIATVIVDLDRIADSM